MLAFTQKIELTRLTMIHWNFDDRLIWRAVGVNISKVSVIVVTLVVEHVSDHRRIP